MRKIGLAIGIGLGLSGAAHAEVVIAALGDSLTQGYGLPQEQGFVPQMQGWLRDQGADVRMINAGVSGDTTAGGAARVDWTLSEDVDGMIVALGGNDLLRGLDPAVSRANLEQILIAARAAEVPVLLVGFEAPQNYGAEFKTAFDGIYPELSVTYGTLYAESFFAGLTEAVEAEGGGPEELRGWLQSDGLHPNAEAVQLIVAGLGPDVLELVALAGEQAMPGRVFQTQPVAALAEAFGVPAISEEPPRRNIAPGQMVVALTPGGLARMRWGMIPVGRRNARGRPVMETIVNARSETVFDKSAFDGVGRAVLPVEGWYEWTGEKRKKTAWRLRPADGGLLYFAAITDVWTAPGGQEVAQIATVTCAPNADVEPIHHRMAVILEPGDVATWLTGTPEEAAPLMRPWPEGRLVIEPADDVDWAGP